MNKDIIISNAVKIVIGIIGFFIVNSYNTLRAEILTFQKDIKALEISVLQLQMEMKLYVTKEQVNEMIKEKLNDLQNTK